MLERLLVIFCVLYGILSCSVAIDSNKTKITRAIWFLNALLATLVVVWFVIFGT
jgi:hypothetical protein